MSDGCRLEGGLRERNGDVIRDEYTADSTTDRSLRCLALLPADVDTTDAVAENEWICRCGNRSHRPVFVPIDRNCIEIQPTLERRCLDG